jgi:hypothetical protein
MNPARALAAFSLLVAGCAPAPATDGSGAAPDMSPTGCAALRDACLANQLACSETSGAAKCIACPTGQYAALDGNCATLTGTPLKHDFSDFTTMPGQEVLGLCQSWTLDNATELWVNAVELDQNEASHHSNWTFVPNTEFPGPDGVWNCDDRHYSQLDAALAGGVLYAQSTQSTHEVQHFPNGAAVRIPPYARIIGDVHLLNASTAAVTGHVTLSIYTLAPADVKVKLVPFHLQFEALTIPPHSVSRHSTDCDVGQAFEGGTGTRWDLKLYYLLPHMHALGSRFFVGVNGGKLDGKTILDVGGGGNEPHGRAYDPPVDLTGADGFRFGCEHTNPRDQPVAWGFGDQEMCELLGFADTSKAFESSVVKVVPVGSDGAIQLFSGTCGNIILPWDPNKPGGMHP